jgi:hypothetical protein
MKLARKDVKRERRERVKSEIGKKGSKARKVIKV